MKITREDLPERQAALILEFENQEIEPALDKTYRKLVGKVNIPGFRPGKAPRYLFERYVGREALVQQAAEDLMPGAIKDAVSTEGLETAELTDMDIESTEPLRVRVMLDLGPLVELGDYSDLRVEREAVEMTEQQVEDVIRDLRSREGTWNDVEEPRPTRMYDRVTVDMETYTTDGPVDEMTGEDIVFQLTERTGPGWPRQIDENLLGMSPGEEKDFAITFPEGYANEALRGREATVHVTLKSIQEQELPELDEDLIKRVSGGDLSTEEELHERIRTNLRQREEEGARQRQIDKAIAGLVERSTVELSKHTIDHEVDHQYERFENDLKERRVTPSRYFSYMGSSEQEWREQERERAVSRLRNVLVLREFAAREGIAVAEADVEAEVESRLADLGDAGQQESIRELFNSDEQRRQIENRVFERKFTDRLIEIVEGRRQAAPSGAEAEATETAGEDGTANGDTGVAAGSDAAAGTTNESGAELPATAPQPTGATAGGDEGETAQGEGVRLTEISGSIPADQQEPSDLELAGAAAEVLGVGEEESNARNT